MTAPFRVPITFLGYKPVSFHNPANNIVTVRLLPDCWASRALTACGKNEAG